MIDVFALLGVSMMFARLKLGFTIYAIFQITYIVVPAVMFGVAGFQIVGTGTVAITMVYIILFATQRKHLIK